MKKLFIWLILITFTSIILSPVHAETLKAGVEKIWTVDSARQEAFKDAKQWLNLSWVSPIDPDLIENKKAINNHQKTVKNRTITVFDVGFYGIRINDEDNYDKEYYYFLSGKLIMIGFRKFSNYVDFKDLESKEALLYPIKTYRHAYPSGKLIGIALIVSKNNSYVFLPSGELDAHWLGNTCYDVKGNIVMTRKEIKETDK
ncbi:MAG: hypothetical protein PHC34_09920 [Candidatus Gastranaerophilales bacterium]|nr:hypothetical protein [Candidatus Gastranaerophilales bacterium]